MDSLSYQLDAVHIHEPQYHATVVPHEPFDAEADSAALRKAMKGIGTDEKAIIAILSSRTAKQRLAISHMFKTMFGRELLHDLKSELSGHFEEICVGLIMDNAHFDARCLRKAMKGAGTDESALIEILCTRNNEELTHIKAAYTEMFQRDLEKDVVSETSGSFKYVLVAILQAERDESTEVDHAKAIADANALNEAGEKHWGTDESAFINILGRRSYPQLRAMFQEYRRIVEYDIVRTIEHEMSGNLARAFKAIVRCVRDKPAYFAERLFKAMDGAGTDDETLVRIVVARSEIDMVEIKEAFLNKYGRTLRHMIDGDCSGDYKRMLFALIGEANHK